MRLLRRRDSRDGGGAVATYAAVLDGARLWLDVEGPVTLRDTASGEAAERDLPADLVGLRGAAYDVLSAGSPVAWTPLTSASGAASLLTRTPLAPDGVTRWEVAAHDGWLRLVRHTVAETAELDAVDVRQDRLHLRVRPPDGVEPGSHLLLLDTDDQLRATLPVTAHDGLLEALVGVDDLPAGWFGVLRVAIGTESSWRRVRRRGDDLADPNHAVLLPELHDGTGLRARLRWNPDGLLALRSVDPSEVDGR